MIQITAGEQLIQTPGFMLYVFHPHRPEVRERPEHLLHTVSPPIMGPSAEDRYPLGR
jgi:hypothetical protein